MIRVLVISYRALDSIGHATFPSLLEHSCAIMFIFVVCKALLDVSKSVLQFCVIKTTSHSLKELDMYLFCG